MAKSTGRSSGRESSGGVSFRTKDQISTGLFGPGPATIKGSEFMEASKEYSASRPIIWLLTYSRPGEEDYESIYSIGKGWDVSKDGALVPKNGQTGLPSSSYGAMLAASLEEAGVPEDILAQIGDDPHVIENTDVELIAKTLPRAEIRDDKSDRGRDRDRGRDDKKQFDKTILLVDKLLSDVGEGGKLEGGKDKGSKGGSSRTSRSSRDKDDEKEEKPSRSRRDEKEEKDEKPARGRRDDKDDKGKDDTDSNIDDAAREALLEALEEKGGKIKVADLESAVSRKLKGNKQKDDILDRVIEDEFLELENGWSYKNGAVALD
jgi:hypothetical protein